ncbi:MAG: NAD-dependent epimerase/dehydratase family protein [Anaerolineae bacterium]
MLSVALVTGATGAIGPSLVNQLLDNGYTVRTYNLSRPSSDLFDNDKVISFQGDITDGAALGEALAGVEVVFHLAALLHIENPTPDMAPRYWRVNVEGSRIVAEEAARAGVRRLVYFSTVKVYGVQQREPVTELHPTNPKTIYAQTKLEGERAVCAVEGLETVVLRLSAVYGPRLRGSWDRLVKAIQRGWFLPVGNLQNVHSLTYVSDVARAAQLAAEHPDMAGGIYNVVGYETPAMREILGAIYSLLGRRLPAMRIPAHLALLSAHIAEKGLALANRRSPVTPDSVRQLFQDEAYSGTALRSFGFDPSVSLEEGWREAVFGKVDTYALRTG